MKEVKKLLTFSPGAAEYPVAAEARSGGFLRPSPPPPPTGTGPPASSQVKLQPSRAETSPIGDHFSHSGAQFPSAGSLPPYPSEQILYAGGWTSCPGDTSTLSARLASVPRQAPSLFRQSPPPIPAGNFPVPAVAPPYSGAQPRPCRTRNPFNSIRLNTQPNH